MIDLSSSLLKAFLEHSQNPLIVFSTTPDLKICERNTAYQQLIQRISGREKSDEIQIIPSLIADDEQALLAEMVYAIKESGKSDTLVIHPIYSNSPNVKWELSFTPIVPENEPIEYIICSLKEIASNEVDIEKILLELSDSESRFRGFFEKAPLGMCVLKGPDLITEYANDNILKVWGKTRKEIIGISQEKARPELESQKVVLKKIKAIFETGEALTFNELKISTPVSDGYFLAMYQPLKNEKNEVISILAITKDITDQVNYKKELQRAKDILKLAMDASGMGSWNIDLENKKVILSERAQQIYNLKTNRLSIEEAKSTIIEQDLDFVSSQIRASLHHKTAFNIEYQIHLKNGSEKKWLRTAGKAYYNEDGKAIYIAGAVLDINDQKQNELRKNDFIGMVSHELKTPLTALSSYIQLLQYRLKEKDDLFISETIDKVSIQLKRMSLMIDGFLNVSLLESGKISLNKVSFDLIALVKTIADENRIVLPSHFIQVVGFDQIMIDADKGKLANVINNLIGNAAKYSKKDSLIAIKCETIEGNAVVSVEDEGIGIGENDLDKLFDRFYRVDSAKTKTIAGFGVGLFICAEVIKEHKGKIWVESEIDSGSTFYFSLPVEQ